LSKRRIIMVLILIVGIILFSFSIMLIPMVTWRTGIVYFCVSVGYVEFEDI